jgi:hypothetical protein
MNTLLTVVVIASVVAVLAAVAYALYEVSPFAHHSQVFHLPGQRQDSPRLD